MGRIKLKKTLWQGYGYFPEQHNGVQRFSRARREHFYLSFPFFSQLIKGQQSNVVLPVKIYMYINIFLKKDSSNWFYTIIIVGVLGII